MGHAYFRILMHIKVPECKAVVKATLMMDVIEGKQISLLPLLKGNRSLTLK
jgi:hypothetical protein